LGRLGAWLLGLFELRDVGVGLVASELAGGLALREPHRAPCISEVDVTGVIKELPERLHLAL
jgi:hypothetical protein